MTAKGILKVWRVACGAQLAHSITNSNIAQQIPRLS